MIFAAIAAILLLGDSMDDFAYAIYLGLMFIAGFIIGGFL